MFNEFELRAKELTKHLSALAIQTAEGKIDWKLTAYSPIGFLLADQYELNDTDTISQGFDAAAILNGEEVTVSIHEVISIPSGKGDFYIELKTDVLDETCGLSFDENYDTCPAEKILEKYGESPIVAFANAIVPYLVQHCQEEIKEGLLGKRFYNEVGIPKKTKELPIVKKAESLCEQNDLLSFHAMVLDLSKRA